MYLQALWALVVFAILSTAWLATTRASVTAAARHAALKAAGLGIERAQQTLVESIALQAAEGASSFIPPTPSPPAPICPSPQPEGPPCLLLLSASATLEGETSGVAPPPNQTAYNLQTNTHVGEQRLAAVVTAVVTSRAGPVVAQLSRHVTLRTLAQWPYVAVSGTDEPTVDGYAVDDFAGSCSGGACGSDSRLHAIEVCSDPSNPALCAGQTPQPVDAFVNRAWHDSNVDSTGWSR